MRFRLILLLIIFLSVVIIFSRAVVSAFAQSPDIATITDILPQAANVEAVLSSPPTTQEIVPFTGQNFENLPWKGSLMFNEGELRSLYSSMGSATSSHIIDANIGNVIDTTVETGIPADQQSIVAPAFYLNSILFYNRNNWTVWINGRRVRINTKLNGLEVTRVTNNYIELIWKPLNLDLISPGWPENMKSLGTSYPTPKNIISEATNVPSKESVAAGSKDIKQMANNIQEVLSSLDENNKSSAKQIPTPPGEDVSLDVALSDLEEIKMAALKPENFVNTINLPPLYEQDEFSINLSKIESLLAEEENEMLAIKKAEETITEAAQTKKYFRKAGSEDDYYAYEDKALPYLWEHASNDENILVDTINGVVQFRIGVGQTFVSKDMQIVEGYVRSTVLQAPAGQTVTGEVATGDLEKVLFAPQSPPADPNAPPAPVDPNQVPAPTPGGQNKVLGNPADPLPPGEPETVLPFDDE